MAGRSAALFLAIATQVGNPALSDTANASSAGLHAARAAGLQVFPGAHEEVCARGCE
jgi:hypothetical protein